MNAFELEIMASHAVRVDEGRFMVFACMKRSFYETALFFGYRLLRIIRYDTMFMSSQLHKRLPLHYFRQQIGVCVGRVRGSRGRGDRKRGKEWRPGPYHRPAVGVSYTIPNKTKLK